MTPDQEHQGSVLGHTAGPWAAHPNGWGFDIFAHEAGCPSPWVASLHRPGPGKDQRSYPTDEQVEANGRLIAAAPDLLEALREVADAADEFEADRSDNNRLLAAIDKARDAIRESEGQQ